MNIYQECIDRILDQGERVTPIRSNILKILCETEHHLTSGEILESIKARGINASRTSVFRTLDFLTKLTILRPTFMESQSPSYIVLSSEGHHAHIICPQCQEVEEIEECQLHDVVPTIEQKFGRTISGHLLEFYGLCTNCQTAHRS